MFDSSGLKAAQGAGIMASTRTGDLAFGRPVAALAPIAKGNIVNDGVNLRAGPGTGYASYGRLASDTRVDVLAKQAGWYRVRTPRGTIGWVSSPLVALDTNAAPAKIVAANDVVRIAQKYVGARYIWGGATPRGFDCSGLTQYVYRQVGVRLPRKASQQFSTRNGKRIASIEALVPGDLVFFERTTEERGITHTGIYVGNGRMIAARSERLGVRYVSMYEPFWHSRFVAGLRVYR